MRILFTTTRFPFPPIKGDKAVPFYRLKYLSNRHEITLLSFIESSEELEYVSHLKPYCARIETILLPRYRSYWNLLSGCYRRLPFQVLYYRAHAFLRKLQELMSHTGFDVVHTVPLRGAPYTMDLPGVLKVLDMIDSLSLNMQRRAAVEGGLRRMIFSQEARRLRRFEQETCAQYARVIVVSDIDRRHLGSANVSVIPLGVELPPEANRASNASPTVIFTGNLAYFPNRDCVLFLAREILPALWEAIPGIRLKIVGPDPPFEVRRLARADPRIELTGFVNPGQDLWAHLRSASVALCPLRAGSGMQFKVLEAMACGVPVVASLLAVGDIAAMNGRDLLVADDVPGVVSCVRQVLENPALASTLAWNGRKLVCERYTWEATTRQLEELYAELHGQRKARSHANWY